MAKTFIAPLAILSLLALAACDGKEKDRHGSHKAASATGSGSASIAAPQCAKTVVVPACPTTAVEHRAPAAHYERHRVVRAWALRAPVKRRVVRYASSRQDLMGGPVARSEDHYGYAAAGDTSSRYVERRGYVESHAYAPPPQVARVEESVTESSRYASSSSSSSYASSGYAAGSSYGYAAGGGVVSGGSAGGLYGAATGYRVHRARDGFGYLTWKNKQVAY